MKYGTIYKAIQKIPYTNIKNAHTEFFDFWVVLEIPSIDKRVWIANEFGRLKIATATLSLCTKETKRQYQESFQHYYFKNVTQMRNFILKNFVVEEENK